MLTWLILIGGALTFHFTCVTAQDAVVFEIPEGVDAYSVAIDTKFMTQFHRCLCANDTYKCFVKVKHARGLTFSAVSVENDTSIILSSSQSDRYGCIVDFDQIMVPRSLDCTRRLKQDTDIMDSSPLPKSCGAFNLNSETSLSVGCGLGCVSAYWVYPEDVVLRHNFGYNGITCGFCKAGRPTTTATLSSSLSPLISGLEHNNGDDIDKNTPVLAGTVTGAVGFIAIIAIVSIILLKMRRKQKRHKQISPCPAASSHYINYKSNLDEYSTAASHANKDKISKYENGPSNLPCGNVKQGRNKADFKYSEVDLPVSPEFRYPEHATTERNGAGTDYTVMRDMRSTESHDHFSEGSPFTDMTTQDSYTPNVYARLGEEVRDMQNTYDVLLPK